MEFEKEFDIQIPVEDALLMVDVFIQTEFDGGRHQNRINKINLSKF